MDAKVFVGSLEEHDYLQLIREGLQFSGFDRLVSPGSRIFIKPNLTFPEYRPGVMTNPQAIKAAILAIQDYTPNIYMGDSDSGGYNRFSMDHVYQATGIREIADRLGVKIVNLSRVERKPIHFEYKGKEFELGLPAMLMDEMDLLVTMPVPKVHCNTGVSLTFKNQWGCIPENQDRLRLHPYFKHVILEINKAVKSKVAIVDGKFGLTRNGPMLGDPVSLDWVLVSNNIGAAAKICCDLMQVKIDAIPHLKYASQQGWIPVESAITLNQAIAPFLCTPFYLKPKATDFPGYLAFHSPLIAYLAYFSPLANFLHKILYLVRKPFYDYDRYKPSN